MVKYAPIVQAEPVPFAQPEVSQDFYKTSGVRGDIDFTGDPGMTRQEFADECDINLLMERYETTGVVSHVNRAAPVFLDTTLYKGLQASMDAFKEASTAFLALPAKVRKEFDNDPQAFVDFAVNPENVERMREWGLAAPAAVKPPPVEVVLSSGSVSSSEAPPAPK
ncbi:MAG: internal scaffolding protein [Microvirus sp.]|nr:MAG: internal scaffolding protein [Microvirus sp.]